MAFPPTGFILGAQKAGTTNLAFLLDQHPEIVLAQPKEPKFFNLHWDQGLDWYRTCFSTSDAILIDASPGYTSAPIHDGHADDTIPRRLLSVEPEARFIYLARDPADRCYSAYWQEVRSGRERAPLREAVAQKPYYRQPGYYFAQITPWLRLFPRERFLFLPFRRLAQEPAAIAAECARFLGVRDGNFAFSAVRPRNGGFDYNGLGRLARDHLGEGALRVASRLATRVLPERAQRYARGVIARPVPRLSEDDRVWLSALFAEDAARFEELTGVGVGRG